MTSSMASAERSAASTVHAGALRAVHVSQAFHGQQGGAVHVAQRAAAARKRALEVQERLVEIALPG